MKNPTDENKNMCQFGKNDRTDQSPILKLSLYSLPPKPPEPPGLITPPLQTRVAIPFDWEEVPGRPKTAAGGGGEENKPKAARCLELPPRLLSNDQCKITSTPSPTTVLEGPYVSRSLSSAFSFRKESKGGGGGGGGSRGVLHFGSWRWGDLKESRDVEEGNFVFSPIDGDELVEVIVDRSDGGDRGGGGNRSATKVNVTRVRKSHLWVSIYESLKKVVPWRPIRQRKTERKNGLII